MNIPMRRRDSGFTMVEIALCLAIVGFALVAIIGVLPRGMNVQRDNRHQTIVNQDAALWLDAIRNGARGYDDLTNYVLAITNYWTLLNADLVPTATRGMDGYSPTGSQVTWPPSQGVNLPLNSAERVIGLLSTPKYTDNYSKSNYVIAYVRSISGSAVEKVPQQNLDVLDTAFTYRLIIENSPYVPAAVETNSAALAYRELLRRNSRDLRLTFRWPVFPSQIGNPEREVGNGRQTYRHFVAGTMLQRNDPLAGHPLYFLQPSTVVQLQ